jgi:hypothetical protein
VVEIVLECHKDGRFHIHCQQGCLETKVQQGLIRGLLSLWQTKVLPVAQATFGVWKHCSLLEPRERAAAQEVPAQMLSRQSMTLLDIPWNGVYCLV